MKRNITYLFSLLPALAVTVGNISGGILSALNLVLSMGILAALEWIIPPNKNNQSSQNKDQIPSIIIYLHIPAQLICIGSFFYGIQQQILIEQWIWISAISMGINSGSAAIVVAHEFIHRKSTFKQFLGKWLLFTVGNFYFYVEHLRVHHKWVGTAKDTASAQKGENLYAFFLRSGIGQISNAWKLESERLKTKNKIYWPLNHYIIRQIIFHLLLDTCIIFWFGPTALLAFVLHCLVANFLLEYVNYIEHYGLSREENERVTELHSWQSDSPISRFLLIDLSRHADHHFHAAKPYHTLDSHPNSPELPSGYAGMFIIAAIPPLWFRMIDKRIPA
ncbi:MAG: alkane 1-monooxygenase [Bacteroidia bacterium]|nr:alkane 1-monooxygenase [Bacteroidia bacterium]